MTPFPKTHNSRISNEVQRPVLVFIWVVSFVKDMCCSACAIPRGQATKAAKYEQTRHNAPSPLPSVLCLSHARQKELDFRSVVHTLCWSTENFLKPSCFEVEFVQKKNTSALDTTKAIQKLAPGAFS